MANSWAHWQAKVSRCCPTRASFSCRLSLTIDFSNVGFTYYGERSKKFRAVLRKPLSVQSTSLCWSHYFEEKSFDLCQSMFKNPEKFYELVEMCVTQRVSTIWSELTSINGGASNVQELIVMITYGYKPDPQYLQAYHNVMRETGEALQPGRWAVNYIPACKNNFAKSSWFNLWFIVVKWIPAWFPGAGFKTWAENARLRFIEVARAPFYKTKSNVVSDDTITGRRTWR